MPTRYARFAPKKKPRIISRGLDEAEVACNNKTLHICICICICIHAYTYNICLHMYIYIYSYVYMFVYIYLYMYIYMCMCSSMAHTYPYMQTYKDIIHTYMQNRQTGIHTCTHPEEGYSREPKHDPARSWHASKRWSCRSASSCSLQLFQLSLRLIS